MIDAKIIKIRKFLANMRTLWGAWSSFLLLLFFMVFQEISSWSNSAFRFSSAYKTMILSTILLTLLFFFKFWVCLEMSSVILLLSHWIKTEILSLTYRYYFCYWREVRWFPDNLMTGSSFLAVLARLTSELKLKLE